MLNKLFSLISLLGLHCVRGELMIVAHHRCCSQWLFGTGHVDIMTGKTNASYAFSLELLEMSFDYGLWGMGGVAS